jgi:hypothetical protein
MPIATFDCPPAIRRPYVAVPRDHRRRDDAVEAFEAGDYAAAVAETLGYLLPNLPIPDLSTQSLCFAQGSARVRVRMENGELVLSTALATLQPDAHATAAMRYFLTRLSGSGQTFQPRLRDGVVALEFRDKLALMHPLKLLEVLQRMPQEADRHDAWMRVQFGVDTPDREPLAPLDDTEFARAEAFWNGHWSAVEELLNQSRRRRSVRFLDALSSVAVNHIRYGLPLFGSVRAQLYENAEDFINNDADPNRRDGALAKCVREMRAIGREELRACLGHASWAINPLQEGTPANLTSMLGPGERMQATEELRTSGQSLEAALELLAFYLYLLAHFSWPEEVAAALRRGLDQASGRRWREAVDALWTQAGILVRQFGRRDAESTDAPLQEDLEHTP